MPIVTIGIDLAKNVFAVHGVDETGKAMLIKPRVPRDQLATLIAQLPACLIGMEACSGAHHWARVFQQHGHSVKLMAPNLVAPYRTSGKRGKNDAADAAAICEAVTRPSMRFVPLKDEHQQATLCLHRTRQGFVEERTATYNRLRGLFPEFGVVLSQSTEKLRRHITEHLDTLPGWAKHSISDLLDHAGTIEDRLVEYDRAIAGIAREDARSRRLMQFARHRPNHGQCAARQYRCRARLQKRPAGGGLDRTHARSVQQWRQGAAGQHHEGRRRLSARPAGQRRPRRYCQSGRETGSLQPVGPNPGRAPGLLAGRHRDRCKERETGVGLAEIWR